MTPPPVTPSLWQIRPSAWLRAVRGKQWIKNVLLFVPLFFAHQWGDWSLVKMTLLAFAAFCAGASATYLLNDLMDQAADQVHPVKRHRPLAAGIFSRGQYMGLCLVLFTLSVGLALCVSKGFLAICLAYVVTTSAYSVWLKRIPLLDVMLLAGFYTLRIFAGSLATQTPISKWLLLFSLFFFLGLAFQKRFAELREFQDAEAQLKRRGYARADMQIIQSMGTASSYLSVLVLALYIQSPDVSAHYGKPALLWGVAPCVLFWVSRIWLLANRGEVTEDAISFSVRDKVSYLVAVVVLILCFLAQPIT